MFHNDGSVIVSFVVYFKTPVTANEGLSKLRDAVDNNRKLGNFTVRGLKKSSRLILRQLHQLRINQCRLYLDPER